MKVNVGSKNQVKIKAVQQTVSSYPHLFPRPKVEGVDVGGEIYGHPKNLQATVVGAAARAKKAFINCSYSFGIESGLMKVPLTPTGFMEVNVSVVYNGKKNYIGLSPTFEWPQKVLDLILSGKADGSQAFQQAGLTKHEKLGAVTGGVAGFLTDNKLTREDSIKHAIIMALIQLDKPEFFKTK